MRSKTGMGLCGWDNSMRIEVSARTQTTARTETGDCVCAVRVSVWSDDGCGVW